MKIKNLINLLVFLKDRITKHDEIVVQMDSMSVTSSVRNVVDNYRNQIDNFVVIEFPLDKDFAQFKNNLKSHCSKEWIFNIDADELPSESLIQNIHDILKLNDSIEMFLIPRWNTVDGITDEHVQKWGWNYDNYGRINWPDYQTRIYKNKKEIVWKNKVHERLSGYKTHATLPAEQEFCFYHPKTIDRQEKQNKFYQEI